MEIVHRIEIRTFGGYVLSHWTLLVLAPPHHLCTRVSPGTVHPYSYHCSSQGNLNI